MTTSLAVEQYHHDRTVSLRAVERWSASVTAAALVAYGVRQKAVSPLWFAACAAPLAIRAATGAKPGVAAGTTTWERKRREAARVQRHGIQVRESVRVDRPVAEVFAFWSRLENLPAFMAHLERVSDTGDGRSHWVARGPGGITVEWDAEIVHCVPNELIAWRTLPGADVGTAGSVRFEPLGSRSTRVTVNLHYQPPAGQVGRLVATLTGTSPARTIREDLRRLRQVLESGDTAATVFL